jgi:hypothetical protein
MKTLLAQSKCIIIAAALYQLTGCAPLAPNLDSNFGNSLNALKAYQTINPQASANTANPDLDGRAANEAINRYHKSFSAPAPHQNVFTIGVGSSAQ